MAEPSLSPADSSGEITVTPSSDRFRGSMILLTAFGAILGIVVYTMGLARGGWNLFEILALPLFAILFTWIVFSFVLATRGFIASLSKSASQGDHGNSDLNSDVPKPTAVLVPVYNEDPDDVFARVHAMVTSLKKHDSDTGTERAGKVHFYVLSDTTDPEIWLAEELAWSRLNQQLAAEPDDHTPSIFYRHRAKNESRKAGNIADFCERWSDPYDCMIILDADSLLEAKTIYTMVDTMADEPELGILQVPPVPIGRESLFARLQQFSAAAYGQISCRGFDAWAGDQGNYWGHNAILRIKAFRESCDLPILPGSAPLGGEILSHDFVEAALMVRDGWKVRLANDLAGSYEECPTTLTDYAMRDQRWCQGNLQHSRLIVSEGFHWVSRLHFISGVLAYAASPLWLAWIALSVAGWFRESSIEQRVDESWLHHKHVDVWTAMAIHCRDEHAVDTEALWNADVDRSKTGQPVWRRVPALCKRPVRNWNLRFAFTIDGDTALAICHQHSFRSKGNLGCSEPSRTRGHLQGGVCRLPLADAAGHRCRGNDDRLGNAFSSLVHSYCRRANLRCANCDDVGKPTDRQAAGETGSVDDASRIIRTARERVLSERSRRLLGQSRTRRNVSL